MRTAPGLPRRVRGFTLVVMMIAAIVAGLATLFVVGGFFAAISDDGRITYDAESDT
jgi:Tfp pilus assembly protein PilX